MSRFVISRDARGGWLLWWRGDLYGPHVRGAVGHKWRVIFRIRRFGRG